MKIGVGAQVLTYIHPSEMQAFQAALDTERNAMEQRRRKALEREPVDVNDPSSNPLDHGISVKYDEASEMPVVTMHEEFEKRLLAWQRVDDCLVSRMRCCAFCGHSEFDGGNSNHCNHFHEVIENAIDSHSTICLTRHIRPHKQGHILDNLTQKLNY